MRLLTAAGEKLFVSADTEQNVPYAILSHRWLATEREVSYHDIFSGAVDLEKINKPRTTFSTAESYDMDTLQIDFGNLHHSTSATPEKQYKKDGCKKIDFCLRQATKDGLHAVWIDSCCIDRRDGHELGKSINRMFQYYANAAICYVYLADVHSQDWRSRLHLSDWFKRGWTLQELVAPSDVRFYSSDLVLLGNKNSLSRELLSITGIETRDSIRDIPIPKRFGWLLGRTTTEPEDMSYCMLGILEVSVISNYGEGAERARDRLLEAVEKEHGRKASREIIRMVDPRTQDAPFTIEAIRSLLCYDGMNSRRAAIADPVPDTCKWLLGHADYEDWSRRTIQFLWIKGKPGSGKSTLMKFIDLSGRSRETCISFYFNARGSGLDRSAEGMYRSLLHQLLSQIQSADRLVLEHVERERSYAGVFDLTLHNLQALFRTVVRSLRLPVLCFVDALDECKDSDVQSMVYFLEDVSFGTQVQICFASRHYPSILIKGRDIRLEHIQEQAQDLQRYVHLRLEADSQLTSQVIEKANGTFIWAVLVIRLLNEESAKGKSYNGQKRLAELPSGLDTLLSMIASPAEHELEFRLAMRWILFAQRPLSPPEYFVALNIDLCKLGEAHAPVDRQPWSAIEPSEVQLERFVVETTHGLAELTKGIIPRVQFVHETVRDFVLSREDFCDESSGPAGFAARCHGELAYTCHFYLDHASRTLSVMDFSAVEDISIMIESSHPLLRYTMTHVLAHAEQGASSMLPGEFMDSLSDEVASELSRYTYNEDGSRYRYWYSSWDGFTRLSRTEKLVMMLADRGFHRLIRSLVRSRPEGDTLGDVFYKLLIDVCTTDALRTLQHAGVNFALFDHGLKISLVGIAIERGDEVLVNCLATTFAMNEAEVVRLRNHLRDTLETLRLQYGAPRVPQTGFPGADFPAGSSPHDSPVIIRREAENPAETRPWPLTSRVRLPGMGENRRRRLFRAGRRPTQDT